MNLDRFWKGDKNAVHVSDVNSGMGDRRGRSHFIDHRDCQAPTQITMSGLGGRLFGIAFALNLAWEMAQMFAYANGNAFSIHSLLTCSGAAVADAFYVMCVYWIGRAIRGTPVWIFQLNFLSVFLIASSGLVTAFIFERVVLIEHWWRYGNAMPRLPFGVGLLPVLQLMILPLAAFWVIRRCRIASAPHLQ